MLSIMAPVPPVFIISVNVLFLSNSQLCKCCTIKGDGVYHKCQCPLFKQFTTLVELYSRGGVVFIISVNVLFLSNSQPFVINIKWQCWCLS